MRPRLATLTVAPLVSAVLLVSGCGQMEQAAGDAANQAASDLAQAGKDAASQAASDIAKAGKDELLRQACKPVKDGSISASDQELISGLLAGAEAAGIRSDVLAQWRQVAEAGDQVPSSVVKAMQDTCHTVN
ncbi:hypothetical protein ACFQ36_00985 [Arthrobacter sp. GCM10027362]|uniref:hypothetical protein n=1 Tax=Arthrobacter sp. GCM10027362 TaxID=3273379 RepID=UPI00364320C5